MKKIRISFIIYIVISVLLLLALQRFDFGRIDPKNAEQLHLITYLMGVALWPITMAIYPLIFLKSYDDTIKYSLIAGLTQVIVWIFILTYPSQTTVWAIILEIIIYMLVGLGLAIALMACKKGILRLTRHERPEQSLLNPTVRREAPATSPDSEEASQGGNCD